MTFLFFLLIAGVPAVMQSPALDLIPGSIAFLFSFFDQWSVRQIDAAGITQALAASNRKVCITIPNQTILLWFADEQVFL